MSVPSILNVVKSMGPALVMKGLAKINPKFKNFFTEAATYGYGTDQALDYLQKRFSPKSDFQDGLEQRESQGNARPDEGAALAQIKNQQIPGKALRVGAAYGGAGLMGMLGAKEEPSAPPNPEEGPLKGVGEALGNAKARSEHYRKFGNYPDEDKQNGTGQPSQQRPDISGQVMTSLTKDFRQLGEFLQKRISSGLSPSQASWEAKQKRTFKDDIEKFESKIGPLEDALEFLFGGAGQQQIQSQGKSQSASNKTQFMQGLGDLAKILQGMKR